MRTIGVSLLVRLMCAVIASVVVWVVGMPFSTAGFAWVLSDPRRFTRLAEIAFGLAGLCFSIVISTVSMFEMPEVPNEIYRSKMQAALRRHKIVSITSFAFVAVIYTIVETVGLAPVDPVAQLFTVALSFTVVFHSVNLGLFQLPKLRERLRSKVRDDTERIRSIVSG